MPSLPLYVLIQSLWLMGLSQKAPVDWACEDEFAQCKENCTIDYGLQGISSPRLSTCLSKCLTTVEGCRERSIKETERAPKGPKPWEKPPEPEYRAPEPTPMGGPEGERRPPAITPRHLQAPALPPEAHVADLPQETLSTQTPGAGTGTPVGGAGTPVGGAGTPGTTTTETTTTTTGTTTTSLPTPPPPRSPPPPRDEWKPWTPPPDTAPKQKGRPIDEWEPL